VPTPTQTPPLPNGAVWVYEFNTDYGGTTIAETTTYAAETCAAACGAHVAPVPCRGFTWGGPAAPDAFRYKCWFKALRDPALIRDAPGFMSAYISGG
jgi:hypothetical protein